MAQVRVLMYVGFERFWHWSQAALIIGMLVTGFEIHGSYRLIGFETATNAHEAMAWCLIGLWIFAWFWHLTTGEWRQYIPSTRARIVAMTRYYLWEIFQGKAHPFHRDRRHKLNPLQALAYLSLFIVISPLIWISGLVYLTYPLWKDSATGGLIQLQWVAEIHVIAAFLMLTFLVVHLYLALTTSEKPLGGLRAMVTGYEPVEATSDRATADRVAEADRALIDDTNQT